MRRSGQPARQGAGVLHQFVAEAVAELGHLEETCAPADLAAAVDADLRRGARARAGAAPRLSGRVLPGVCAEPARAADQLLDGVGGMLAETLRSIARDDVLIVASFQQLLARRRRRRRRLRTQRGVPVIAITDSALSPLKPSARVCFELGQAPSAAFRSLVAPMCLAQALVVSVGHKLAEATPRAARGTAPRRPPRKRARAATETPDERQRRRRRRRARSS